VLVVALIPPAEIDTRTKRDQRVNRAAASSGLTSTPKATYAWSVVERKEEDVMKVQIRVTLRLDAPLR
jgi:hypothetical protein